ATGAGFCEQRLQDLFRLFVFTLAELLVADFALRVDEVERRPVLIPERAPDPVLAVDGDRIADAHRLYGVAYRVDFAFERKLRRVHAEHYQALVLVLLAPRTDVGMRAQPVDAGEGPELDEDHLAAEVRRRQRRGVDPSGRTGERRHLAVAKQAKQSSSSSLCENRVTHAELGCGQHPGSGAEEAATTDRLDSHCASPSFDAASIAGGAGGRL